MSRLLVLLLFVLASSFPQDEPEIDISNEELADIFGTPEKPQGTTNEEFPAIVPEVSVPEETVPEESDNTFEEIFGSPEAAEEMLKNPEQHTPPPPVASEEECICVMYYQCVNGSLNVGGIGIIDIRFDKRHCASLNEICCKAEHIKKDAEIPNLQPITNGCGFRNIDGVGFRITGDVDSESQFGEFPWTGIVLRKEIIHEDTAVNVFQCGCSLIHPRAAITAAHCVVGKKPELLKLRFGEWDTKNAEEVLPHQDRNVVHVIIHENFYAGALYNDIALLIFDKPVDPAANVNNICLPPPRSVFDGSKCFASGWGKDNFSKAGKYQLIMKKVELDMVSHRHCQTALRTTRLGYYFNLHQSFVCAGGNEGKDTCTGDGGSPLMCPVEGLDNRYYQVGIVAWGIGCGAKGIPGVYVNVPLFTAWIERTLSANGIDEFFHKP